MRLLTVSAELRRLVIGCLFLFFACAAPAALVGSGLTAIELEDPELWKLALCAACAILLPLGLVHLHASELAASSASLETIARALITGMPAVVPRAVRTRELADAAEGLVHAANTVRQREFGLRAADRLKDDFLAALSSRKRKTLTRERREAPFLWAKEGGEWRSQSWGEVAGQERQRPILRRRLGVGIDDARGGAVATVDHHLDLRRLAPARGAHLRPRRLRRLHAHAAHPHRRIRRLRRPLPRPPLARRDARHRRDGASLRQARR